MGDFFKPWRRKAGVFTLAMACVFMAGWIRSLIIADVFGVILDQEYDTIFLSSEGMLGVGDINNNVTRGIFASTDWITDTPSSKLVFIVKRWYGLTAAKVFRVQFCGICFVSRTGSIAIVIRYWFIVLPLTLISAWLLLSKPRSSSQKKNDEPIPNEAL